MSDIGHPKFLMKPEGLRQVSKAMVVQDKVSELNFMKSQTPRKKESNSDESKTAFGNNFSYSGCTHKTLAKNKNAQTKLKRKVVS